MMQRAIGKFCSYALTLYTYLVIVFFEKPKGVDFILRDAFVLKLNSPANSYMTVSRRTMLDMLLNIPIQMDDAFLDIGCGKGYLLYLIHRMGFRRIHGIELSSDLCKIANKNMQALNLSDKITVDCINATEFRNFEDYSILYMFNPFYEDTMKTVIDNVEDSLRKKPRKLTIIYLNPCCHNILDNCKLLRLKQKRFVRLYNPFKKRLEVYYYSSIYC